MQKWVLKMDTGLYWINEYCSMIVNNSNVILNNALSSIRHSFEMDVWTFFVLDVCILFSICPETLFAVCTFDSFARAQVAQMVFQFEPMFESTLAILTFVIENFWMLLVLVTPKSIIRLEFFRLLTIITNPMNRNDDCAFATIVYCRNRVCIWCIHSHAVNMAWCPSDWKCVDVNCLPISMIALLILAAAAVDCKRFDAAICHCDHQMIRKKKNPFGFLNDIVIVFEMTTLLKQ